MLGNVSHDNFKFVLLPDYGFGEFIHYSDVEELILKIMYVVFLLVPMISLAFMLTGSWL